MTTNKLKKALLIVDPQFDFIDGSLPVPQAKEIMDDLTRYIVKYGNEYSFFAISCDNHPYKHISFNTTEDGDGNRGQLPSHCVEYTHGASLYTPLINAVIKSSLENGTHIDILPKGMIEWKEEYSVVDNVDNRTLLCNVINAVEQIDVCGIAGDVCVLETLKDLLKLGFCNKINVLEDFCPSFDEGKKLREFININNN